MKPALYLFWTRDASLVGWLIRRVTAGPWQHVGIRFDQVYFEAHAFGSDKGFRGPKPLSKLLAWARKPGNVVHFEEVKVSEADYQTCMAWCEAESNKERRGYDVLQLLRIYLVRRLRWLGLTVASDPSKVCCHEAVIRCLRVIGIDLTSEAFPTPDSSDPSRVYLDFIAWKAKQ